MQQLVIKAERLLSNQALYYVGLAIWLTNSILTSTFAWTYAPGFVSKFLRYLALGLVVVWSVSRSRSRISIVPAFVLMILAVVLLSRSFRAIRYGFVLLIPLGELFGEEGLSSRGAWVRLAVSVLLVVISVNAESVKILDLSIFILAASSLEPDGIMMMSLVLTAGLVSAVFVLADFGVISDYVLEAGVVGRARHYMGFGYALFPARYLFLITALATYLKKDKIGLPTLAILFVANAAVYKLADSRLAFYCAALLLAAVLLATYTPLPRLLDFKPVRVLAVSAVLLCAVLAVALAVFYTPSIGWMESLNASGVLTGRLKLGHDALTSLGVPILGQKLELVGNGLVSVSKTKPSGAYNYIDSIYVQALVNYGPVVWAIYVVLQMAMVAHAVHERDMVLTAILLLFAAEGIIDDAPLMLQYNTFLLLCAPLVSSASLSEAVSRAFGGLLAKCGRRTSMFLRKGITNVEQ